VIPIDCGHHSDDRGQAPRRRPQGGHGAGLASSPDRLAAALGMLSPLSVSLWALWTSRSRMASATVGLAIASCQWIDRQLAGHDGRAAIVPVVDDLQQIAPLLVRRRDEPPVVVDQKLDACQGLERSP